MNQPPPSRDPGEDAASGHATRSTRVMGIRHHGPGSARSVVASLEDEPPDVVLVEGPPEAAKILGLAGREEMRPPVALLIYAPKEPQLGIWYPMAEFSPEWQAIRWAIIHEVPVRLIDLPAAVALARIRDGQARARTGHESLDESEGAGDPQAVASGPGPAETGRADTETEGADPDGHVDAPDDDPLSELAAAAGYDDAERWWEDVVEHRGGSPFDQIEHAMRAMREAAPPGREQIHEDQREAQMRMGIRAARKEGFEQIAVVCGAWHVPALTDMPSIAHDRALVKGLPKIAVEATWVPWTNGRLALRSGYGAGVRSPGWYHHVFTSSPEVLIPSWLSKTARLLRDRDLDAPPAMVVDAVRLTDALASIRHRPLPGLDEVLDATQATLCGGNQEPLVLVHEDLVVGDVLGSVPQDTPSVPIAADLAREQRRVRLKPEAGNKLIDLDLRRQVGLDRSHLLRRLNLLEVRWGALADDPTHAQGTFHELWELAWAPELALALIDASGFGTTIAGAATARSIHLADRTERLATLTELIEECLLADLPRAVDHLVTVLSGRAAVDRDATHLMEALGPLARVLRYGSVRAQHSGVVAPVVHSMALHAAIGLPLACASLDDAAAARLVGLVSSTSSAIGTLSVGELSDAWAAALAKLADQAGLHKLLAGRVVRLLVDSGRFDHDEVAVRLSLVLSAGTHPAEAAAWIEGFLSGSGLLLVHDQRLLELIDDWLSSHDDETFCAVLPLLRRAVSAFEAGERRAIQRVVKQQVPGALAGNRGIGVGASKDVSGARFDHGQADAALPVVELLLGLDAGDPGARPAPGSGSEAPSVLNGDPRGTTA